MGQRIRLDQFLVQRGWVASREKARALILEGRVWVEGHRVDKAGALVSPDAAVEVQGGCPYVSRGGQKLEAALRRFSVDVRGKVALDCGASTGGFTDCLLQHGARKVYAVDVGYGQLDWRLRKDPRVIVLEKTHILRFPWDLPNREGTPIQMVTLDLSFISLKKVLPALAPHIAPGTQVLALVKPQFEVGPGRVGRGGIVRDPHLREEAVQGVEAVAREAGFQVLGRMTSPLPGQKGNIETFLYLIRENHPTKDPEA